MDRLLTLTGALLVACCWSATTLALVVDGMAEGDYGSARSIQNTNTAFGDSTTGDLINSGGGSEVDQVFGTIAEGRLYVTVAGNLEPNFNKLIVFIDSTPGGVNSIDGFNLPRGLDAYCCGHFAPPDGGPEPFFNPDNVGGLQRLDSLKFDAGFAADHVLSFTHGFEEALASPSGAEPVPPLRFWALSAHYADLTQGPAGAVRGLGVQFAQQGRPNVLRGTTADVDVDGDVDGTDLMLWQQYAGSANPVNRRQADVNYDGAVDDADRAILYETYGFKASQSPWDGYWYAPQNTQADNSAVLLGPALPGLGQGELIDQSYVLGPGGATDIQGTGAIARELGLVLPVVPDTNNAANHRNMENIVDLQMALDNGNVAGVVGSGPYEIPTSDDFFGSRPVGDPQNVRTGLEFSIPLSAIGNPSADVKITAFIANWAYDYLSNQVSGDGALFANLGGLMPDFDFEFFGNQYVVIPQPVALAVPEPAASTLLPAAALFFGRRGRR